MFAPLRSVYVLNSAPNVASESTLCLTLMIGAQEWVVRGDAPGLIAAEQRDRRSTSRQDQPNKTRRKAQRRLGELSDLPRFGCCLSESTHDILSGNHAYQLPLGRHYGETSHLEANHQLEDPR